MLFATLSNDRTLKYFLTAAFNYNLHLTDWLFIIEEIPTFSLHELFNLRDILWRLDLLHTNIFMFPNRKNLLKVSETQKKKERKLQNKTFRDHYS